MIYVQECFAMSSSKSFMGSCIISNSLGHFEFISVYAVRKCPTFTDLHEAVQLCQHHLIKRLSFLHCIFLSVLSKINRSQVCVFISGLSTVQLI